MQDWALLTRSVAEESRDLLRANPSKDGFNTAHPRRIRKQKRWWNHSWVQRGEKEGNEIVLAQLQETNHIFP